MIEKKTVFRHLGAKTTYRMDYAPEVLETSWTSILAMITGYVSTALSLHHLPITGQPDFAEIHQLYSRRKDGREQESETLSLQFPAIMAISMKTA